MALSIRLSSDYSKNQNFYARVADFVDLDPAELVGKGYIRSYDTEDTTKARLLGLFQKRVARSYPLTISDSILAEHVSACSQEVTVDGFEFDEILSDVTGFGDSAATFFSSQVLEHFKNGFHGVLIESPEQPAADRGTAVAANERSYQTLFSAENIIQCEYFKTGPRRGQVKDVILLVESSYYTNEKGEEVEQANARRYYFNHDNEATFLYQELSIDAETLKAARDSISFEVVVDEPGNLPVIPFVAFGRGPTDSAIRKTIPLDIGLLNTLSTLRNTNYHQAFQRVMVFGVRDAEQAKTIGEAQMGFFPEADAHADAIPPGDAAALEREINFILHWTRRIGMRQFRQLTDDLTKQVSSAESKAKDLAALESWYSKTLDMFERKLKQVYQIMFYYEQSKESTEIEVKISRDFGLDDSEAQLMTDSTIWGWSQEFDAEGFEIRRRILISYLDQLDMTSDTRQELSEKLQNAQRRNALTAPRENPLTTLVNDAEEINTGTA